MHLKLRTCLKEWWHCNQQPAGHLSLLPGKHVYFHPYVMPLGPAADTEGLKRLTVASNRWDGPPGPNNLRASTAGSGSQPQAQGAAMSRWAAAQQPTMCRTAPFSLLSKELSGPNCQ